MTKKIALFASGSGSNAENIYHYFSQNETIEVAYLICNNPNAGVIEKFKHTGVAVIIISKSQLSDKDFLDKLIFVDLIVLVGFLVLIPPVFLEKYGHKTINLHPSLLPKYGGKGMYGDHVHQAVLASGEVQSGITIHRVNSEFDQGEIIFQATCNIDPDETLETLKVKIHLLEFEFLPKVIASLLC